MAVPNPPICPVHETEMHQRNSRYGLFFGCPEYPECDVTIGCHQDTGEPLGYPGTKEVRKLRMEVHALLDPIWQQKDYSRGTVYAWLAEQMGIPEEECHVGMFDEERCLHAIDVLERADVEGVW